VADERAPEEGGDDESPAGRRNDDAVSELESDHAGERASDPGEVREALLARARRVRSVLFERYGEVPERERVLEMPDHEFPAHPNDLFPWAAVALVVDPRERCLLIHHRDHDYAWEPPGGKGEPPESFAETAARETREETGVDPAIGDLLRVQTLEFDYGTGPNAPVLQAVFAGQVGSVQPPEVREAAIPEARWFGADELPEDVQFRELILGLLS